jgi:phage gpG-like protein
MPLKIEYSVEGATKVRHDLLGMSARALEPAPLLEAFADQLRGIERDLFDAEGYGWAPLAASTVERKGSATILRESDDLFNSLTQRGAKGSHQEIFGSELVFGTEIEYATFHRTGTSRMPQRDPLPAPREQDLRRFTKAVQAWLIGGDRAEFGVGSFGAGLTNVFGA